MAACAKVSARDQKGATPLHNAAKFANVASIEALLAVGADVMARDTDGKTPLLGAGKYSKYFNYIVVLVFGSAGVVAQDKSGNTPLHDAAKFGNSEIIEAFLGFGADAKAQNKKRHIPWD